MARGNHSSVYFDSDALEIIETLKEQLGPTFKLSTYICDLIKKDNKSDKGSIKSKENSILQKYQNGDIKN